MGSLGESLLKVSRQVVSSEAIAGVFTIRSEDTVWRRNSRPFEVRMLDALRAGSIGLLAVVLLAIPGPSAPAAEEAPPGSVGAKKPLVLANAIIHTATADEPVKGWLHIEDGKIVRVGLGGEEAKYPKEAEVRDLKGAVIIPGLVDTHSHIGLFGRPGVSANADGNEMTGPVQTGVRAIDSINPDDPGIRMAVTGGVTTANIMPGSANVIGGSTLYVKLRGRTIEEMRINGKLPDGTEILGGLKMANGENPKGYGKKGQAPFTRMKVAALQREQFLKAREYKAKKDAGKPVDRDLSLEPIVEVLEKKRTVHFHCHRADDLITAVRIAEEFGFELVLQHATEGYRVAEILAKKQIPVSLTLIDSPGGKAETIGLLEENAAVLAKAGVNVTINTDDFVTESRFLLRTGAIAVRGGMTEAQALKALTINAAKIMHLDHRVGSLEPGKDADFVVLSGAPFSVYTQVLETFIEGRKLFDRSNKRDWSYQAGGFALPGIDELPMAAVARPDWPNARIGKQAAVENPPGPERTFVFADFLHTAAGNTIANGWVMIEKGLIKEIGSLEPAMRKGDAVLRAKHVTPGLIDPFSSVGLSGAWNIPADQDQDELSDPNQADLRVLDGFNPQEPLLEFLVAKGTTIVHAVPGRQNVIAGQSAVFRSEGKTAEQASLKVPGAILVNLGEVPKGAYKDKGPATRMAVAKVVREAFAKAQEKANGLASGGRKPTEAADKPTASSPRIDALIPAIQGKVPVYFAAHRADDIATALRIADEFKLKPVIALGTEAYRMADVLKKAGVPVVVHPTMQRAGGSMETLHSFLGNAAVLADAGIPITIGTAFEGYVPKTRVLRHEAAMAAANGLGFDRALKAVTIDAAKLLGIDDKYGSIEKGKVADLVLYDGDPFEHSTHVTMTLLGGKVAYDRSEYLKLPFERRILTLLGGGPGTGCCLTQ